MRATRLPLIAATACCVVSQNAIAELEEITVTAQRRDAGLQSVPISVSAFSEADMGRLQIDMTQDIAVNVPNMQTYNVTGNGAAMQLFMRGAGVQNPGFNASEAPVGIYVDDIYRGRLATANLDLSDVERIEVLRGPQGTLYGRNTIAGAVKVITRTPEDEFWANGSVAYGNYETSKAQASIGGPILDGKLGGSISGSYHNRDDGWIERGDVGGRDLGEFKNKAVRGKLNWFAGDVFNAKFSVAHVDVENDGYNGIPYGPLVGTADGAIPPSNPGSPLAGFYDTLVPEASEGLGKTTQTNLALDLSWQFNSLTLHSITGYSDIDDEFRFDINAGALQLAPGPDGVVTGITGILVNSDSNNKTFTQEFTLAGSSFNDRLEWITGVFYMNEDGEQTYNPSAFGQFINEDVETETDSYAVFAEGSWGFTDRLSLTLGGRWTRDEKDYSNVCTDSGAAFPDVSCTGNGWSLDLDRDFDEFTPRAILEYQVTDNTLLFGSVSKGFQAGGFQTLCFGDFLCNLNVYDPQKVWSWETGVKSDFFDNSMRINASAFYAQYDDLQQTAVEGFAFPLVNVGDADVAGIEVETFWTPLDGLDLFLIYGYMNEDIDSATEEVIQSSKLPGLARHTARLGFEYRLPLFSDWEFLLGADAVYSDEYLAALAVDPGNQITVDDYTRYNGRLGLEQPEGHWSFILSGRNITDEDDNYSGIAGFGANIRTPQPPREYLFTVSYRN